MQKTTHPEFGECLTTKNLLNGKGRLKWCVREYGVRNTDNGWRFFSEFDTEQYLEKTENWSVVPFDTMVEIEPSVLALMWFPMGTEITIEYLKDGVYFFDDHTGQPIIDPLTGEKMIKRQKQKN
jgi:hypothetical protein